MKSAQLTLADKLSEASQVALRRHPRTHESKAAIAFGYTDPRLRLAIGVIGHDDAVDVVLLRHSDDPLVSHAGLWPNQHHGRWRWSPSEGLGFMDGTVPDAGQRDAIEQVLLRELRRYALLPPAETMTGPKWTLNDGGRGSSQRPKQRNDCVVRAAALVVPRAYDLIYDYFAERGRKCSRGTKHRIFKPWFESLGASKTVYQAVKGQARTTLGDFVGRQIPGRHIAQVANHVLAVIDGIAYDTSEPRWNACLYATWHFPDPT